ncbi:MAG TPA: GNAT family protein [Thermomicrobiales bacterium]|nr:GNAT family protein [Thermomicrobiales bacterium]
MDSVVSLRRPTPDDAELIHAWRAQPSIGRFQPTRLLPVEHWRDELARQAARPLDSSLAAKVQWLIEEDDLPAGWISLDVTSRTHGIAAIGYSVSEEFRGRRLVGRALRQVIAMAFDPGVLALERLEAVCSGLNVPSRRVLAAAGFREEGIARGLLIINGERVDHIMWGLLRTDLTDSDRNHDNSPSSI